MEVSKRLALGVQLDTVRASGVVAVAAILLAALLGLLNPALSIWVLLGGTLVILACFAPWAALAVVPLAVTLDTVVELQVGPLRAGPTDVVVGALLIGALVRMRPAAGATVSSEHPHLALLDWVADPAARTLGLSLAAYLTVIVLSLAVAHDHSAALKEVLKWAEVLVVFAFGAVELNTPGRRLFVAWIVIAAGVVEALIGYGQWVFAAGELGVGGASIRVFGSFGQPNPFAAFLNLALPFALALAAFGRQAPARWLAGGAAVLLLGAQGLAASRGGLLGLAAAVIVMAVFAIGIERLALIVGILVGAVGGVAWAVGIVPAGVRNRLLHVLRLDNVSLTGPVSDANFSSVERLAHWVAGLRMFAAHPLLGVGAGNYSAAYPRYKVPGWDQSLSHAHNYYINAAAETGLLGLLAVVAVMLGALWLVRRAARRARPELTASERHPLAILTGHGGSDLALAVALGGIVAAVVVHSVVDDVFVHGMELQFALLLGLAAAIVLACRTAAASSH